MGTFAITLITIGVITAIANELPLTGGVKIFIHVLGLVGFGMATATLISLIVG